MQKVHQDIWWSRHKRADAPSGPVHLPQLPVLICWYHSSCSLCKLEEAQAWPKLLQVANKRGVIFQPTEVTPHLVQQLGILTVPTYHFVQRANTGSLYGPGTTYQAFGSTLKHPEQGLLEKLQHTTR